MMKVGIGNDHAGVELKNIIVEHLENQGVEVINFGTDTAESCSYTLAGKAVAHALIKNEIDYGVLICGTGVGISLSANKVRGIRAAVCSEPVTARLTRLHNDAQIVAFGARIVGSEVAKSIVDEFLATEYEGGRHQARVDAIEDEHDFEGSEPI